MMVYKHLLSTVNELLLYDFILCGFKIYLLYDTKEYVSYSEW